MNIRIEQVTLHDDSLITEIASETYRAFHHLRPTETVQDRIEKYEKRVVTRPDSPQAVFDRFYEDALAIIHGYNL
jgi:hypothetical protein